MTEPPEPGTLLRVKDTLGTTEGMCIRQDHLSNRRAGAEVRYKGIVPGHGGDVWWVEHADGSVAAYSSTEVEATP